MGLKWIKENPPTWDADKQRVVGAAAPGVFHGLSQVDPGALLPGEWWRAERDGRPVAYGWMDVTWGDAEVLVAVDPAEQRSGVGTYVFDRLEEEAGHQGLRYLYNVVPPKHPDPPGLTKYLQRRGFVSTGGGVLRRQVR